MQECKRQSVDLEYSKSLKNTPLKNIINGFAPSFSNSINEKFPTICQNSRFASRSVCGAANYSDSSGFCSTDSAYWQLMDGSLRNSQCFNSYNSINNKSQKSKKILSKFFY